jgi:nucleoside-diphosphate-sugar epimerase
MNNLSGRANLTTKILITGASGFLGAIFKDYFMSVNFHVISLSRRNQMLNVDMSKAFRLSDDLNPDIIIHTAGKAHSVPKTVEEEREFFNVNYDGTKNLCKALNELKSKPKAFIFISTVAVYGIDEGRLIEESHPLNGNTPYAKSKILAENYLVDWAHKNNIKLGILRLPLIGGPNPPGNLGAMIKGIKSGKYLSIGKADAHKSIVWAEDIARIIPVLAEIGGTYNLTDTYHPSFKELEAVFAKSLHKKDPMAIPYFVARIIAFIGDFIKVSPLNSDKLNKMTSTLTFNDEKAQKMLGWNPNFVLEKFRNML